MPQFSSWLWKNSRPCTSKTVLGTQLLCSLRSLDSFGGPTVRPKVPEKSNVPCFSAICGWILKPFDLQIAMKVRFVMIYDNP